MPRGKRSLGGRGSCRAAKRLRRRRNGSPGASPSRGDGILPRRLRARERRRSSGRPKLNFGLLTIALDHLTLGRAALYAAVLSSDSAPPSSFHLPTSHLASAVSGLRRAGQARRPPPQGLLTRAWQRSLAGALTYDQAGPESAQSDLDEAWDIAERGPMPLYQADILLTRARLFGLQDSDYPWESAQDDLAEAERLIKKHGYGRREGELADAKEAFARWQEQKGGG